MVPTSIPLHSRSWAQERTASLFFLVMSVFIADLLSLSVAVFGGFFFWHVVNPTIPPLQGSMYLAVGFSMAVFAAYGMYPGIGKTAVEQMRLLCQGVTLSYLMLLVSIFLIKEWWAYSRGGFLFAWLFSLLLVPIGRQLVSAGSWWGVPVMIIGTGETAQTLIRNLRANRAVGYKPIVCLRDAPSESDNCEGIPIVGGIEDAARTASHYQTHLAIVAIPGMDRALLVRHLRTWSGVFPNILIVPDLFGVSSLWIEPRDLGGMLGFEIQHSLLNRHNRWIKRGVDVVFSVLGLLAAFPLLLAALLLIKRASRGPAFYTQERDGKGRHPIRVLKLRTMYLNAEEMLEDHLDKNPADREEWDRFCKLKNDPRILPGIGEFLRKTSLDEVPQLWNVLKGEMSMVGPRPFPAYHNDRFNSEFVTLRTEVTPGLTGLWQISARSEGDMRAQESLDSYYILNWSIWLDTYILIRTVWVVLAQKGAC